MPALGTGCVGAGEGSISGVRAAQGDAKGLLEFTKSLNEDGADCRGSCCALGCAPAPTPVHKHNLIRDSSIKHAKY